MCYKDTLTLDPSKIFPLTSNTLSFLFFSKAVLEILFCIFSYAAMVIPMCSTDSKYLPFIITLTLEKSQKSHDARSSE